MFMGSGTGQFKKNQIVSHIQIPKCCNCWKCEAPWGGKIKSSNFSHILDGPNYSVSMVQIAKPDFFSHNLDLTKEVCTLRCLCLSRNGLRLAHTLTCLHLSWELLPCTCKAWQRGRSHQQLWVTVGCTEETKALKLSKHHRTWPSWSWASGFPSLKPFL